VFLGLAPVALGIGLAVWLAVLKGTRMVSAASITAALAVGIALVVTPVPAEVRILGFAVVAFVIFAHRSNIGRILNGTEARFGRGREPEATVAAAAVTADAEKPE
jgi:acyl phosphate:glycerol-3-phosphate acyltransferase